jgi:hypothetical protein
MVNFENDHLNGRQLLQRFYRTFRQLNDVYYSANRTETHVLQIIAFKCILLKNIGLKEKLRERFTFCF